MDKCKKYNEGEMGSGDSDDEFYNVKLNYTQPTDKSIKKMDVKKVYSPPRTKVQYDYKFDSSSDEESESGRGQNDQSMGRKELSSKEKSSDKSEREDKSMKDSSNLPTNTSKVVEKINEELKNMKNAEEKTSTEKTEGMVSDQNQTSVASAVSIPQTQVSVVSPVMVVPPPMVVPQPAVMNMGPMLVPSPLGMPGQNLMTMMSSQNMMGMAAQNMLRGASPIGGIMTTPNALPNSMMGMNALPGMMGIQSNLVGMGLQGGVINPAAMGGINMAMQGNLMRMTGASNSMLRMQGGGNIVGIPRPNRMTRPLGIPAPPAGMMVNPGNVINSSMITNPGGLMVMGGVVGTPNVVAANQANVIGTGANLVKGNNSVRPVPPFPRAKPPVPANFRWPPNLRMPKTESSTVSRPESSPDASSPTSSPLEKDYDGDELSRDDRDNSDKSPTADSDESQSPPPREIPNTFKNDGSFMEIFKKMREESNKEAQTSGEKSGVNAEGSDSLSAMKKPPVMISGIVGKRRGGRVLKTGLVKKVKKDTDADEEKHPKDAWSMYMAEVKKYREASCEEEGKTRPLVK